MGGGFVECEMPEARAELLRYAWLGEMNDAPTSLGRRGAPAHVRYSSSLRAAGTRPSFRAYGLSWCPVAVASR